MRPAIAEGQSRNGGSSVGKAIGMDGLAANASICAASYQTWRASDVSAGNFRLARRQAGNGWTSGSIQSSARAADCMPCSMARAVMARVPGTDDSGLMNWRRPEQVGVP